MPFKKVNIKEEIAQLKKDNLEFKDAYELLQKEKFLLNKATIYRKKVNITQPQLADRSLMTQQAVSRIERNEVSPTRKSFIRYLDGMGLELDIRKKKVGTKNPVNVSANKSHDETSATK